MDRIGMKISVYLYRRQLKSINDIYNRQVVNAIIHTFSVELQLAQQFIRVNFVIHKNALKENNFSVSTVTNFIHSIKIC